MPNIEITRAQYRAAADRCRRGRGTPEDEALCDAYHRRTPTPRQDSPRSVYDLPIARRLWRADVRDAERGR